MFTTDGPPRISITDILKPKDRRGCSSKSETANVDKYNGLLKREALEIKLKEDVPDVVNIPRERFILSINNSRTERQSSYAKI